MAINKLPNEYNQNNTSLYNGQQVWMVKKSASFWKRAVSSDSTHKDKSTIDNLVEYRSMSKQPTKTVNKDLERVKTHYKEKSHYTREMIGFPKPKLPASKDIPEESYLPDRKDILKKSYGQICKHAIRDFKEAKISEENLLRTIKYCYDSCLSDAKIIKKYKEIFQNENTGPTGDKLYWANKNLEKDSVNNEREAPAVKQAVYEFIALPSVSSSKRYEAYKLISHNLSWRSLGISLTSMLDSTFKDNKISLPLTQAAENINFVSLLLKEMQTYTISKTTRAKHQWDNIINSHQKSVQETAKNITKQLCEDPKDVLKIETFLDLIQDDNLRSECKKIPERMNLPYKQDYMDGYQAEDK